MTDSQDLEIYPDALMALASQNEPSTGCCSFEVAGVELVADPAGILWWQDEKTLVVSDLHLEKGSSFARRGQLIPPYDTKATLQRLARAIDEWQPNLVISLGDSFHDANASARLPLDDRQTLQNLAKSRNWMWITGNHDPQPPKGLAGDVADTLAIGPLHFCHEPQPDAAPGQISGHLHPKAKLKRQSRSITRSCFATSRERLVMPSFGAYTGGLNVLSAAYKGLFDRKNFYSLMIGEGQVYKIAGSGLCL